MGSESTGGKGRVSQKELGVGAEGEAPWTAAPSLLQSDLSPAPAEGWPPVPGWAAEWDPR